MPISSNDVATAIGGAYDRAAEHEYKFISYAGAGGTNTYVFLVDGNVITASGLDYYFDGAKRHIGVVGVMDTGSPLGTYIDDFDVRLNFDKPTYENWAIAMGLVEGVNDARSYDAENGGLGDGMENLLEYALGGDPLADDAASILPDMSFTESGGTNYMEYVYRRRLDAAIRGLVYDLQYRTNLVTQVTWASTGGFFETGTSTIDSEFEAVTNAVDTTGIPELFLNLEITEN